LRGLLGLRRLGSLRGSGGGDFFRLYLGKGVGYGLLLPADRKQLLDYLVVIPLVLARLEDERD